LAAVLLLSLPRAVFAVELTIGPDAVFHENTAGNGVADYGLGAGLRDFPNIRWSGENSVPHSHLLNNYDVNNAITGVPGPLTVVFDLNGGRVDGLPDDISVAIIQGEQIGMGNVPVPTRTGYDLSGWQIDRAGEALSAEEVADITVNRPMLLVAVWVPQGVREAYLIGSPDGRINPLGYITRAEVATILFRLISDADRAAYWEQSNPFTDVEMSQWFHNAVSTTTNMDLFDGEGDGEFAPDQPITRAELAVVMGRFLYATGAVQAADALGLYRLGGEFYPDQPITRAEVVAMLNHIYGRLPETADDLLPDMRTWPDNADAETWYYLYLQSASNAYTYQRKADGIHERWIALLLPRDWAALERPDSTPEE